MVLSGDSKGCSLLVNLRLSKLEDAEHGPEDQGEGIGDHGGFVVFSMQS